MYLTNSSYPHPRIKSERISKNAMTIKQHGTSASSVTSIARSYSVVDKAKYIQEKPVGLNT